MYSFFWFFATSAIARAAEEVGTPVVVKPQHGNQGRGVAVNLTTREQVLAAYRAGYEVLEARIRSAVREAADWREELRLGFRAYLRTLEEDPLFARVYLIEGHVVAAERERLLGRFAARYARTFAKSGRPVPPPEALFVLAVGVHELACARVRGGGGVLDLEQLLVSCAVRLAAEEEEPWT